MKTLRTATISQKQISYTARFIAEGRAPRGLYSEDYEAWDAACSAGEHDLPQVGESYIVTTTEYAGPDARRDHGPYLRWWQDNGEGIGGNSNPHIMRYHGWRGTTSDYGLYAHGVRECVKAEITGQRSKRIRIVFGPDQVADRD